MIIHFSNLSKKTAGKTDGFLLLILLFQSSPHTWYSMNNILFISDYLSESFVTVSYTHLDVYKRQLFGVCGVSDQLFGAGRTQL